MICAMTPCTSFISMGSFLLKPTLVWQHQKRCALKCAPHEEQDCSWQPSNLPQCFWYGLRFEVYLLNLYCLTKVDGFCLSISAISDFICFLQAIASAPCPGGLTRSAFRVSWGPEFQYTIMLVIFSASWQVMRRSKFGVDDMASNFSSVDRVVDAQQLCNAAALIVLGWGNP